MKQSNLIYSEFKPALVDYYRDASREVYNFTPRVNPSQWPRFGEFEDLLVKSDYRPKDYAMTISKVMEQWAREHNLKCVPWKVFVSEKTLRRYARIAQSLTVSIPTPKDDVEDEVLYSELEVARRYIYEHGLLRMGKVVMMLKPVLSERWIEIYETGGKRPTIAATKLLCAEMGVDATNYNGIIAARL